jgi:hypothetical protein
MSLAEWQGYGGDLSHFDFAVPPLHRAGSSASIGLLYVLDDEGLPTPAPATWHAPAPTRAADSLSEASGRTQLHFTPRVAMGLPGAPPIGQPEAWRHYQSPSLRLSHAGIRLPGLPTSPALADASVSMALAGGSLTSTALSHLRWRGVAAAGDARGGMPAVGAQLSIADAVSAAAVAEPSNTVGVAVTAVEGVAVQQHAAPSHGGDAAVTATPRDADAPMTGVGGALPGDTAASPTRADSVLLWGSVQVWLGGGASSVGSVASDDTQALLQHGVSPLWTRGAALGMASDSGGDGSGMSSDDSVSASESFSPHATRLRRARRWARPRRSLQPSGSTTLAHASTSAFARPAPQHHAPQVRSCRYRISTLSLLRDRHSRRCCYCTQALDSDGAGTDEATDEVAAAASSQASAGAGDKMVVAGRVIARPADHDREQAFALLRGLSGSSKQSPLRALMTALEKKHAATVSGAAADERLLRVRACVRVWRSMAASSPCHVFSQAPDCSVDVIRPFSLQRVIEG